MTAIGSDAAGEYGDALREFSRFWLFTEAHVLFVVDRIEDCQEVERYLTAFPEIDRARVMLMPQGTDAGSLARKAEWLEPYCAEHGLTYCPRRQIEWFGLARGT